MKDFEDIYINKFIYFIKTNNYGIEYIENINLYREIIKLFIIKNNLNQSEIEILLSILDKNNILIKNNIIDVKNKLETFDSDNIDFFDKLANNDINTWIFIGMILISFIIIIMVVLNK